MEIRPEPTHPPRQGHQISPPARQSPPRDSFSLPHSLSSSPCPSEQLRREHRGGTEITEPEPTVAAKTRIWQKNGGRKITEAPRTPHPRLLIFLPPIFLTSAPSPRRFPPRPPCNNSVAPPLRRPPSFSFLLLFPPSLHATVPPHPALNRNLRKRTIKRKENDPPVRLPGTPTSPSASPISVPPQ